MQFNSYQTEGARGRNNTVRALALWGEAPLLGGVTQEIQPQGGITVLPIAEGELAVVSDNANDTFGGAGLQALVIQGVDGGYTNGGLPDTLAYYEEVILMNGTSPVTASIDLLRVVVAAAILSNAVGTITVSIDAVTQLVILPATAFATSLRTVVPQGWTIYGHGFTSLWSAANAVEYTLLGELEGTMTATVPIVVNQHYARVPLGVVEFIQRTDVLVYARRVAGGGTDRLGAHSDGFMEKNVA